MRMYIHVHICIYKHTLFHTDVALKMHMAQHICMQTQNDSNVNVLSCILIKISKWIHKQKEYGVLGKYFDDASTFDLLILLETGHLYLCQPANPIFKASVLIFRIQLYILLSPAAMPTEVTLASK